MSGKVREPTVFGERFRVVRVKLGWSRKQLAQLANIDPSTVRNLELNYCPITRATKMVLLKVIAKRDADQARFLVALLDRPDRALEVLGLELPPQGPPPPVNASLRVDAGGQVIIGIDAHACGLLIAFAKSERRSLDGGCVKLSLSVESPTAE